MGDLEPALFLGFGVLGGLLVVIVRRALRSGSERNRLFATGPRAGHGASRLGLAAFVGAVSFLLFETVLPALTASITISLAVLVAFGVHLLSDVRR